MEDTTKGYAIIVAELIPLLDREQDTKWAIGDVLVDRIVGNGDRSPFGRGQDNGANGWFTTIARLLAEQGYDVSEDTLRDRYRTSLAFAPDQRRDTVAWATHYVITKAGPSESATQRMADFLNVMSNEGTRPSRRNAEKWLGVNPSRDYGAPAVRKFIEDNPEVAAQVIAANPEVAKAVAANPAAHVAVVRERGIIADEQGIRDPAELDRERERKRLAQGPTLVEILELSLLADKAAEVARKFQTPEGGPGQYTANARIQIEAALARIRAAAQHVEDVMNGVVDTRIPDDISGLVSE